MGVPTCIRGIHLAYTTAKTLSRDIGSSVAPDGTQLTRCPSALSGVVLAAFAAGCGFSTAGEDPLFAKSSAIAEDLPCADYHVDDGTEEGHSTHLGCTGLYSNWSQRVVAPDAREFTPGYTLWSDGADKNRWIFIPPGSQIDTGGTGGSGAMDDWIFPVGTKAWKQFSFGPRLVETRLLWKRSAGWFRATYVWSDDESNAMEYTGSTGVLVEGIDPEGPGYEIPPASACVQCHGGASDTLLGFEAISLAVEEARGLTLDELVRQELLTENPDRPYLIPGDVDTKEALGWLHSNCGTACHNDRRLPGATQLHLSLKTFALATVEDTDTWTTAVGRPSRYRPSPLCGESPWLRISPGDPECSTVSYRARVRDAYPGPYFNQMPPLLSHRVSVEAVEILRRWIVSIPPQAPAQPSPPTDL